MKKKYLISVIIMLLIFIGYVIIHQTGILNSQKSNINEGTNIGDRAPGFILSKMNGDEIKLSDLRGNKVLLNFWATWCPPCRLEMPDIQKLYEEHKEVAILAVNIQEEKKKVIDFMLDKNYNFTVALDETGQTANNYLVRGIPTTYILDENGVIIDKTSGPLTYEQMLEMLKID